MEDPNKATTVPAETFDQILASERAKTALTGSRPKPSGVAKLNLRKEAVVNHLRTVERRVVDIDDPTRASIRKLVNGELPWPLFLWGLAGRGKTCAALCLLDHAGGEYWTVARLCADLIEASKDHLYWHQEGRSGFVHPAHIWERIEKAPLVVLDELGARERVSDHHYETVQRVLDDRQGQPLVCISNLDEMGITKLYDDRILSRLASGTVIQLQGDDRRLR